MTLAPCGVFLLGRRWFAPGCIEQVWNLPALSGVLAYGIPVEELLFGFAFGAYWTGVYEHLTWSRGAERHDRPHAEMFPAAWRSRRSNRQAH